MIRALFLAIILAAVPAAGWSAKPDRSGFYDNLRYIAEADDYVGVRLDVRDGPQPAGEFELCEGWCNGSDVFPARMDGSTISFVYQSRRVSENGQAGSDPVAVSGRFVRRGIWLKIGDAPAEFLRLRRPNGR